MLWPENVPTKGIAESERTSEDVCLTKSGEASNASTAAVDAQKTQCWCEDE